eukprot:2123264-Rhodomonas_salina.1
MRMLRSRCSGSLHTSEQPECTSVCHCQEFRLLLPGYWEFLAGSSSPTASTSTSSRSGRKSSTTRAGTVTLSGGSNWAAQPVFIETDFCIRARVPVPGYPGTP